MTTGTDMPAALPDSDARFLSELAQQLRPTASCVAAGISALRVVAVRPRTGQGLREWRHDGY